jgi:fructose/tagatose bisphosphate aldolase
LLEQFIREQAKHLKNTTLVLVDGVHIADLFLQEVEESIDKHRHSVEYIRGADGKTELEVEHVDADEDDETATEEPLYTEPEVQEERRNALA